MAAGGPEVSSDNDWLLEEEAFDLLVEGEGEEVAKEILDPARFVRPTRESRRLVRAPAVDAPPGKYPNPWLSGYLDPEHASVHLETVRGCPAGCVYCAYRRAHPHPRIMGAPAVLELLEGLASGNADEVVFLDPTFNSRPDLIPLLRGMRELDMDFFCELRGDLVTAETAVMIRDAGFTSVEIGLQSCNRNALRLSGRPGDPLRVLQGALLLKEAGVTPVIDIMLGLPGDTPDDAVRTALMVRDMDLHRHIQVFHISALPGTPLRRELRDRGTCRPPYYMFDPPSMGGYSEAREAIADIAGYDLDLEARPVLFENWPGTFTLDPGMDPENVTDAPSLRHSVLRIPSRDPWEERRRLLSSVRRRMDADPFCVLDVVIQPEGEFPLDLIGMIRALDDPVDYSGRTAAALGLEGNLRVAILIGNTAAFSEGWIESAASMCTVALDAGHPGEIAEALLEAGVCLRLKGTGWDISRLATMVPSLHQLFFSDIAMEEQWSRAMDL
jgi:hypothetical protein